MYRAPLLTAVLVLALGCCLFPPPNPVVHGVPLTSGDRVLAIVEVEPGSDVAGGTITVTGPDGRSLAFNVYGLPDPRRLGNRFVDEMYLLSDRVDTQLASFLNSAKDVNFRLDGTVTFLAGGVTRDSEGRFRMSLARWREEGDSVRVRKIVDLPAGAVIQAT